MVGRAPDDRTGRVRCPCVGPGVEERPYAALAGCVEEGLARHVDTDHFILFHQPAAVADTVLAALAAEWPLPGAVRSSG